ncbi:hypothetical protein BJY04DRAFT_212689 [Aspergillus karnatakaensis]|uniref:FAD-binding oxidoreductase n=1 Tax=Aspergillus karnatakaensis TaxID=1810916 RepID=UPI003CCDB4CB
MSQESSQVTGLTALLPGTVRLPGSNEYDSLTGSYFAQQGRLRPACYILPTSAEDVALAVKYLAQTPGAVFAIRASGTSPVAGAANIDNGITIDLRRLNNVHLKGKIACIGSGASWSEVYNVLVPQGLICTRRKGGISTFSQEHGYACDSVVNMQVVLASGDIVDANEKENPDLFAALKGGQHSFGIVTRFDLKTFDQGQYWGGAIQHPSSANAIQLAALETFLRTADPHAQIEQSFLFDTNAPDHGYSSNNMFYTKPVVDAPAIRVFTEIQPQIHNSMRLGTLTEFSDELSKYQPMDKHVNYATTTFRLRSDILSKVHASWLKFASELQFPDVLAVLTLQALPPLSPTSTNSLGFTPGSHPENDHVLCLFSNYWSASEHSERVEAATWDAIGAIDSLAAKEGLGARYRYINYAGKWQDPMKSYGDDVVEELWRVSKKYDPEGVFQVKVPGGVQVAEARSQIIKALVTANGAILERRNVNQPTAGSESSMERKQSSATKRRLTSQDVGRKEIANLVAPAVLPHQSLLRDPPTISVATVSQNGSRSVLAVPSCPCAQAVIVCSIGLYKESSGSAKSPK